MRSPRRPEPPLPPVLPKGRVVELPGRGELFVREGEAPYPGAPVILLLHGWTATADLNWFQVYDRLAAVGRVVAVDHRGHGRSLFSEVPFTLEDAADDAAACVSVLGLGPVVAVGYSMGGPIACLMAHRHPEAVRGLVLCATAMEWHDRIGERVLWKVMRGMQILFKLGPPRQAVERYLRRVIERTPELAAHRGWLVGELRRGDPVGTHQAGLALGHYDARPFIGSVTAPAAVVITTRDRLVPRQKQRALASAVRPVRVVELRADHDACLLKPVEFGSALVEAVTAVVSAGPAGAAGAGRAADGTERVSA